jgi:hypothetical protein
MQPKAREWPATRWRLTAPEAYVLQTPRRLSGLEAFKLGLRELILRKALTVEPLKGGGLLRRKHRSALRDGPQLGSMTEPALTALLALYGRVERRRLRTRSESHAPARDFDGVLAEDLAKAGRKEFTRAFAGYVDDQVCSSLTKRGLLRQEQYIRFGLFVRRRHALTATGQEAAAELEQWLRVGHERLSGWVRQDPARALAYAGGAGTAVILMPSLYHDLDILGEHVSGHTAMGGAGALGDMGGLDLSGLELDIGAFDGVDSAFGALDAGVDAGAGVFGGGGDGGGAAGGG